MSGENRKAAIQFPEKGTPEYLDFTDMLASGMSLTDLGKKTNHAPAAILRWIRDNDVMESVKMLKEIKYKIAFNVYESELEGVLKQRLTMLKDDKTNVRTKRDLINDIVSDLSHISGIKGKDADDVTFIPKRIVISDESGRIVTELGPGTTEQKKDV